MVRDKTDKVLGMALCYPPRMSRLQPNGFGWCVEACEVPCLVDCCTKESATGVVFEVATSNGVFSFEWRGTTVQFNQAALAAYFGNLTLELMLGDNQLPSQSPVARQAHVRVRLQGAFDTQLSLTISVKMGALTIRSETPAIPASTMLSWRQAEDPGAKLTLEPADWVRTTSFRLTGTELLVVHNDTGDEGGDGYVAFRLSQAIFLKMFDEACRCVGPAEACLALVTYDDKDDGKADPAAPQHEPAREPQSFSDEPPSTLGDQGPGPLAAADPAAAHPAAAHLAAPDPAAADPAAPDQAAADPAAPDQAAPDPAAPSPSPLDEPASAWACVVS